MSILPLPLSQTSSHVVIFFPFCNCSVYANQMQNMDIVYCGGSYLMKKDSHICLGSLKGDLNVHFRTVFNVYQKGDASL